MADGKGGSVTWSEPGYVEPTRVTGNRSFTDYAQTLAVKETRNQAFREGTGR